MTEIKDTGKYQLMPDMGPAEFEALRADIAERGVVVPIDIDEAGEIIDGQHSYRAWLALKKNEPPPTIVREGLSYQDKRAFARKNNILRRHLTREQVRAIVAAQLKDTPQWADNRIAKEIGVDGKTVEDVRAGLLSTSEIPKFDRLIGADGKERPAKQPRERKPKINRIAHALGFEELVDLGIGEGRVASEIKPLHPVSVAHDHRLQHRAPAIRAMDVTGSQSAPLDIAELVEHEQRVIAGAAEMAVIGAAFLIAVGRALARIHVEHDGLRRSSLVHLVDPLAGKIGESSKVLGSAQPLRLEPAHLAGRSRRPGDRPVAHYPAHRRVATQSLGVVQVLIAGQPADGDRSCRCVRQRANWHPCRSSPVCHLTRGRAATRHRR